MVLQPVRGTRDILPEENRRFRFIADKARKVASTYGYAEIATPIFESTDVYKRTLGEVSDVVTKEMYTFIDRNESSLTLRPEGTAGIARAVVSGGLLQHLPLRYYYEGPMFRHERPQKGRHRQFHQIGVELLGAPEPQADVEVIALGAHIIEALGVQSNITLELNSLGDLESRSEYRRALVGYLESFRSELSEESQVRLSSNPLRILDSKSEKDQQLVSGGPIFSDYLNEKSEHFIKTVCNGLDSLGIKYELNPRLVRGFDYYCHTAFEFKSQSLGSQDAVIAGGRYDGLLELMGSKPVPGVGWAGGIERLALLIDSPPSDSRTIAMIPLGEAAEKVALRLTSRLRHLGLTVDYAFSGNLRRRMKRADKVQAVVAVIIGDDELLKKKATLRDLETGKQQEVFLDDLVTILKKHVA